MSVSDNKDFYFEEMKRTGEQMLKISKKEDSFILDRLAYSFFLVTDDEKLLHLALSWAKKSR